MRPFVLAFSAFILLAAGCASNNDELTPAERERQEFLTAPAPVRIAFESEHPRAEIQEVTKTVLPSKIIVWEITYVENGQVGTVRYESDEGRPREIGPR